MQRSTSIFEVKRSKSEEELFQIDQKEDDDSVVKESTVSGGYMLVNAERKKERSSLFDDDELLFDDSEVVSALEKETKKNGSFSIDDFVMVPDDVPTSEPVCMEDTAADPLSDKMVDNASNTVFEDFPPKKDDGHEDDSTKPINRENSAEMVKVAVDKKKNAPSREEKKPPTEDKPTWMLEAQRRKERRLLEKEKEKDVKQSGVKDSRKMTESPNPVADVKLKKTTPVTASSAAKKAPVEEDIPEWRKRLRERRQRNAERTTDEKKLPLSAKGTSMTTTTTTTSYVSRRERLKDAKVTTDDKKTVDEKVDEKKDEKVEDKVEEQKEKDEEEQKPKEAMRDKKSKSPSPFEDKPPLSPKPKLEDPKSPTATTKPSISPSKPELKKKPSVEVTISSVRRDVRRPSGDQDKEKSPIKESKEAEPDKSSATSKGLAVSPKVTPISRTASSSSEDSVPKWKKDLAQQKKTEKLSVEKTSREASVTSPIPDGIPDWKRKLLEKRKQKRTPSPTDDPTKEVCIVNLFHNQFVMHCCTIQLYLLNLFYIKLLFFLRFCFSFLFQSSCFVNTLMYLICIICFQSGADHNSNCER